MERTIDVTTARRQFGTLLDEVFYKGDIITIERKGKPLARGIPVDDAHTRDNQNPELSAEQKSLLKELHGLPAMPIDQDPTSLLRTIRKQKRIKVNICSIIN